MLQHFLTAGFGWLANSLELGCDCLGEIRYFDAVIADPAGEPQTITNAICMHEEDFSIAWKHVDMHTGRTEVRRRRRLVISMINTNMNYKYGLYWSRRSARNSAAGWAAPLWAGGWPAGCEGLQGSL